MIDIVEFRDYCLSKPLVTEGFPFNETTLVFKVSGKMFALCDVDNFRSINLKCEPNWAEELRQNHPEITPGFHMNKRHWNTIDITKNLSRALLIELIDHSYNSVVSGLPKKTRDEIKKMG